MKDLLISQGLADKLIKLTGELPHGMAVYPSQPKGWPDKCVWLRALGDFAHIHPVSLPCPEKKKP